MTIGKRFGAWLLLGALFLTLSGCGAQEADFPFEALLPVTDTESEAASEAIPEEKGYYRIIVSADASAELLAAARAFAAKVEDATDRHVYVVYDADLLPSEKAVDILLGDVGHGVAQMLLKDLKDGEYLCRMQEGVIVLGGRTDAATVAAIERFCTEWLPYASSELLMRPDGGFLYDLPEEKAILLNGYPLSEYRVILPDDAPAALHRLSEALRDRLAQTDGSLLSIVSLSEYNGSGRGIFLEVTADPSQSGVAHLIPREKGILLCAPDLLGVSVAVRTLCEAFSESEQYALNASHSVSYEKPQYRIATVLANHVLPFDTPSEITAVTAPITEYGADCVLIGEVPEDSVDRLNNNLLSDYVGLEQTAVDGTVTPVYAKSGAAEVLSSKGKVGELSMTVCRVGKGDAAFLLIGLSGSVTETRALTLSSELAQSGLPVMILLHTEHTGGSVTLSLQEHAAETYLSKTYTVRNHTYTVTCYGTANAFCVTEGNADDSGGYRDVGIERVSVLETKKAES
ncbi:MAG: hypothetical protein E7668_03745 [Ruminococcaceae bacterium]|nr:hypothetical protein [Oscillospiraceae bacterium]